MRAFIFWGYVLILLLSKCTVQAQVASFNAPDTVCINAPVNLTNTSTGGTSFYWNFCAGSLFQPPDAVNLGNLGGSFSLPVFVDMAKEGDDYYVFVINNNRSLVRLFFGTSLLNTPTVTSLGNVGGVLPVQTEGLQIVQDANGWHIIVVGGGILFQPTIAKVTFGSSLSNAPTAQNWGNIGNLAYPTDLYMFQEGGTWYGLTVNADNNTVTRFNFGTSFSTPPTGQNLGNLGNLSFPTGVYASKQNGNWYVFITNTNGNSITRLDFGNSLLNTPTAINLGNPNGLLNAPRDIYIINDCGGAFGLLANGDGNDLLRLEFEGGDITGNITATSYGNVGNLAYPHSISTIFREKDDLYTFVTNPTNNTLTRVKFSSCTSSSIASSIQTNPPSFSYTVPGIYTVNMMMDEGLASQQTTCKTIVVVPEPVVNLGTTVTTCNGTPVLLNAGAGFSSYKWSDNSTGQTLTVSSSGNYSVEVSNGGCSTTDDVAVTISPLLDATVTVTNIDCDHTTGSITVMPAGGIPPYTYTLNGVDKGNTTTFDQLIAGDYTIVVKDNAGCTVARQTTIIKDLNRILEFTVTSNPPSCNGLTDGTIDVAVTAGPLPVEFAINNQPYQLVTTFDNLGTGVYTISGRNSGCVVNETVTLTAPDRLELTITPKDEICERGDGSLTFVTNGGTAPFTYAVNNIPVSSAQLFALSAGYYNVAVTDANGCTASNSATLNNIILPAVEILNHDTTINIGETVHLYAINAPDYVWTPAEGLSCTNCSSPVARPLQQTTYVVNTVSGLNCEPTAMVTIYVNTHLSLFVPTAFTPNNDGVNDYFRVKAKGVEVFKLMVYNRWGQLLFTSNDPNKGWDGFYQHELQPAGGYVYLIEYAYYGASDKILQKQGAFTLVR